MTESTSRRRRECPILRTHKRFLLRQLEFTQQYALMYRCRLEALQGPVLAAIIRNVESSEVAMKEPPMHARVLELIPSVPALCVGVLYKQMKLLPSFLTEYQKELVRIDAGEEDNDVDGEDAVMVDTSSPANVADAETLAGAVVDNKEDALACPDDTRVTLCNAADELMLEDSSGRVFLEGLKPQFLCTGLVMGVYGTLDENGRLHVQRYALRGVDSFYVPRPVRSVLSEAQASDHQPCYIAFVGGLGVNVVSQEPNGIRARTLVELLIDYICGNVGDARMVEQARCISRLVIGGNSIAFTDEQKLKRKVRLDPSDHARLNDDKTAAGVVTSSSLMRELDPMLAHLAASVEVELMPGDADMSNAFHPQQPLHPLLLPQASRYSTLRLVSNPYEFTALVGDGAAKECNCNEEATASADARGGVQVFVTAGQNVTDVVRETKFPNQLDAMMMMLASGCACPTAPNTLFSYPFRNMDPFLFAQTPHCFVACEQPRFETRFAPLNALHQVSTAFIATEGEENSLHSVDNQAEEGIRLVCVPSFRLTGKLVLVDVHSRKLDAFVVDFSAL